MKPQWKTYEHLFAPENKIITVTSLDAFFALPKTTQAVTFISERVIPTFPIQECHEPLLPIVAWLQERKSDIRFVAGEAAYGAQNIETHGLRTRAAERLLVAEKILQSMDSTLTFKITDSFRPISLQKRYFDEIYGRYTAQGLTGEELYTRVTQVIADPECHPAHSTGGTVDLTIINATSAEELDMGSVLDDVDDVRALTFAADISAEAKKNRLLLYTAMTDAGFVNSPSEWWHYTYGTQEWAIRSGEPFAFYDVL